MARRSKKYEGEDEICCRLCGKSFQAITWGHLKTKHGLGGAHAVEDYKKRFGVKRTCCAAVQRKRDRSYALYLQRHNKQWSKQRLIVEIKRRHAAGQPLNRAAVAHDRRDAKIHYSALRIFKSWDRALAAAGFAPKAIRLSHHWSKAEVIGELRRLATGKVFIPENVPTKRYKALYSAARATFGSWTAAVHEAGLRTAKRPRRRWTKQLLYARIRERARANLGMSEREVRKSDPALYAAARRLTGKPWSHTIQSLGYRGDHILWTKQLLIEELRRWHRTGSTRLPGVSRMALRLAAEDAFGSWWKALAAAKIRPRAKPPVRWTRAEVLKRIRTRHREGKSLSWKVVLRQDKPLYRAARRWLGKPWSIALRELGYDGGAARVFWTDDFLLAEIRRAKQGRLSRGISKKALQLVAWRRFGSWKKAQERAG